VGRSNPAAFNSEGEDLRHGPALQARFILTLPEGAEHGRPAGATSDPAFQHTDVSPLPGRPRGTDLDLCPRQFTTGENYGRSSAPSDVEQDAAWTGGGDGRFTQVTIPGW
jgi:hypothetical protein